MVFVVLCRRPSLRGRLELQLGRRVPAEWELPGLRLPRALRPECQVSERSETNESECQQGRYQAAPAKQEKL